MDSSSNRGIKLAARKVDFKGYYWNKTKSKYQVKLRVDGKLKSFGHYPTEQDASARVAQLRNEF